jgi:hypothetical protein
MKNEPGSSTSTEARDRYLFCFRLSVAGNTHESPSNTQQQQQQRRKEREREGKEAKTERTENEKVS